jgi:hypothetical protein
LRQLSGVVITTPSVTIDGNGVGTAVLPQTSKAYLLAEIGEIDRNIADGSTPDVQVRRLLSRVFILGPAIQKNKREEQAKLDQQGQQERQVAQSAVASR